MDYNLQIQKLLVKVEQLDLPDDKIRVLKDAINIADAHNDLEWGFDLRLEVMEEEFYTPHDNESFKAFTWLLNACDEHPDLFDEDELLWKYKWMISAARGNPDISLEQFNNIIEDFKIRLGRNGYSLRSYYDQKLCLELYELDNVTKAKEYLDLRDKEERDDMSDCRACELDESVSVHLADNNLDRAIALSNDLFNGKLSCAHVPFSTYCSFISYFHEKKNMEKAHEFFLKAEKDLQEMENDSSQIGNIGNMIHFLAEYDKEKAWQYFEKYIHSSLECNKAGCFEIYSNVLTLLQSGGTRTMNVNSALPWFKADGKYNVQELYEYYKNNATDLAKQFDKRNNNEFHSKELNKKLGNMKI